MARGRARRGPLFIAVVSAVLFGSAGRALARDEPERISTFYAAPPECPGREVFADEVEQRTRRPWVSAGRSSTRTFRVTITFADGAFRGRLITESPSGSTRSDEVVWDACEVVFEAAWYWLVNGRDPTVALLANLDPELAFRPAQKALIASLLVIAAVAMRRLTLAANKLWTKRYIQPTIPTP